MSLELKVTLLVTFLVVSVFANDESTLTAEQQQTETLLRERRDGYGGGYGGGGGGYGNSYGGYGCSCPYVHCDNQSNGLLAFGVGALLGLLLALLRNLLAMAAMAPAPAPAPAGRFDNADAVMEDTKIFVDYANNVSWAEGHAHTARAARKSTLLDMLHLPPNLSNDLGPVIADVMRIYTEGGKKPECMKRWVCEATRDAVKLSGFSSRLASLSSLAIGWYTNDITPILQTIFPEGRQIECEHLSPTCDSSLRY